MRGARHAVGGGSESRHAVGAGLGRSNSNARLHSMPRVPEAGQSQTVVSLHQDKKSTLPAVGTKDHSAIVIQRSWRKNWRCMRTHINELLVPIVQFSTAIYYCREQEGSAVLKIERLVRAQNVSSCQWETRDWTAKGGQRFRHGSGVLTWQPGEWVKNIEIEFIDCRNWQGTLEFIVVLSNPEGCTLGNYLHTCRVKTLDADTFPTNRFRKQITEAITGIHRAQHLDDIAAIHVSDSGLFLEYVKMNLKDPVIRKGTMKTLVVDTFENLSFFWVLWVMLYFINHVLMSSSGMESSDDEGGVGQDPEASMQQDTEAGRVLRSGMRRVLTSEKPHTINLLEGFEPYDLAVILAVLYVSPCFVMHYLNVLRCKFKVAGRSKQILQAGMLRRFLNYNDHSRSLINGGDLAMAIARDAEDVVLRGYANLFPLMQGLSKLSLVVVFEMIQYSVMTSDNFLDRFLAFMPFLVFPICMGLFMALRSMDARILRERQEHARNHLVKMTDEVVGLHQLIAAYFGRPHISDHFDMSIKQANKADVQCNIFETHAEHFSKWLTSVIVAAYLVLGCKSVIDKRLPIGNFLATVAIYKSIGTEMTSIYRSLVSIQSVMASLRHIIRFMNLPTDLDVKYARSQSRLQLSSIDLSVSDPDADRLELEELAKLHNLDQRRIVFSNVSFAYSTFGKPLLQNVQIRLGQGRLTCILGHQRSGKTALLKLIGHVVNPTNGVVHVPAHLRVTFVPQTPLIMRCPLFENLTFGLRPEQIAQHRVDGRVTRILRLLNFKPEIIALLYSPVIRSWHEVLSDAEKHQLCLARALIYNPEVLVVDRPLMMCEGDATTLVLKALRDFVDKRGLEHLESHKSFLRRRLRTCIYTSEKSIESQRTADQVFYIRDGTLVPAENVDYATDEYQSTPERPMQFLPAPPLVKPQYPLIA